MKTRPNLANSADAKSRAADWPVMRAEIKNRDG